MAGTETGATTGHGFLTDVVVIRIVIPEASPSSNVLVRDDWPGGLSGARAGGGRQSGVWIVRR